MHLIHVLRSRTYYETSYRREIVIRRAGSEELESATGYGIASVFTPERNRGKGYARRMMQLLHWVLAPRANLPPFPESWGAPPVESFGDATVSVLYSDIGEHYYANAGPDETAKGWITRDPVSTMFEVPLDQPRLDTSALLLSERECLEMWEKDSARIRSSFPTVAKGVGFSFLPENGLGRFMLQRVIAYNGMKGYKAPQIWGASLGDDAQNFVTWVPDKPLSPPSLVSTRLHATPDKFP